VGAPLPARSPEADKRGRDGTGGRRRKEKPSPVQWPADKGFLWGW
jgi:hypothetical protein